MKAYIGQAKLVGPISRYSGKFNFLELGAEPGRCPRPSVLRRWREEVSKGFVFSVRMARTVGAFDASAEEGISFGLTVADALEAPWLLVQTPSSLGPGQRNRDRLRKLFERLLSSGRHVAWDPRGLWGEDEVLPIISDVDVQWARDPSRYEMVEEPLAYGRIPALGVAARVGLGLAERAADNLRGFEEVFLVIEGDGAGRAAKIIRDALNEEPEREGEFDDSVEEMAVRPQQSSGGRALGTATQGHEDPEDADGDEELDDEELDDEELDEEELDDEELDDEELDDEELDDEELDEEELDDEELDDEEPTDHGAESARDGEALPYGGAGADGAGADDEDSESDPELEKPQKIDDSDLPWAPRPKGKTPR